MAAVINALRDWFTHTPDPRAGNPGALDEAYRPAAVTPVQELLNQTLGNPEPLVFLGHSSNMDHPFVVCLPFSTDRIGDPNNTGEVYAIVGDIPNGGGMPPAVSIGDDGTVFDPVNVDVPTLATIQAAWAAGGAGITHLDLPAADTENIQVRPLMPLPHPYVPMFLEACNAGHLTCHWLVTVALVQITATVGHLASYAGLVDLIRAIVTNGQDGGGNAVRSDAHLEYTGVFGLPRVTEAIPLQFARFCPGTGAPTTLQASLTDISNTTRQVTQSQQTIATTLANQSRRRTLEEANPTLSDMFKKVSQTHDVTQLSHYAQNMHLERSEGRQAAFVTAITTHGLPQPLVDVAITQDGGGGRWVWPYHGAFECGITSLRIATFAQGPDIVRARTEGLRRTGIMEMFHPQSEELVRLALAPAALCVARDASQLEAKWGAFLSLIGGLWATATIVYTTWRDELYNQRHEITQLILMNYFHNQQYVCFIIEVYAATQFNRIMRELLQGDAPTLANPVPTVVNPRCNLILEKLRSNSISTLIDLPNNMFQQPQQAPIPHQLPPPQPQPANPGPQQQRQQPPPQQQQPQQQQPPQQPGRRPVNGDESWNRQLRQAWANTGHRSLCRQGAPLCREDPTNRNRVVLMRPGHPGQRTCTTMALTGVCMDNCRGHHGQLTAAETNMVCQAAGLPAVQL